MNSNIFKSLSDRHNIAAAYNSICESAEIAQRPSTEVKPAEPTVNGTTADGLDPDSVLSSEFPGITEDSRVRIDDAVADLAGADDIIDAFEYTIPTEVGFHIENDGIGSYEWWGHTEYDKGTDYPVVDGIPEGDEVAKIPGATLVLTSDESDADEQLRDATRGGEYDSGRAEVNLNYRLVVTDAVAFSAWVRKLAEERSIPLGEAAESMGESAEDDGTDGAADEGWLGRGRNIEWTYVDILKYTKSLMRIRQLSEDIIYHRLWDMQFSEGKNREKVFSEVRKELDEIRKESARWAPSEFLPGYRELMKDMERLDRLA